jgi:protein involved in polysaccharide export with SLBB domain
MYRFSLLLCSFGFGAFLSLTASSSAVMAAEKAQDIASFVDPNKIAIDPVLLKMDDLSNVDFSAYAPNGTINSNLVKSSEMRAPASPLEEMYSARLREPIFQFGYDAFPPTLTPVSGAAVQESYILEAGDEVNILIRGSRSTNMTATIAEDGTLAVEDLPPINAAGKSIKSAREELRTLVSDIYNTELFLSVTKTRLISVSIAGDVARPGQVTVSTFNTVIDALGIAGGIKKTGSLRQIKIVRNEQTVLIDLYGILIYGSGTTDISLRDGDRIVVPPIGPTLAIAGAAKRPAIYEILPANRSLWKEDGETSQKLSLDDVVDLAGGALFPSKTRYIRLNLENKNADDVSTITNSRERIFGDGDILLINQSGQDLRSGNVELSGTTPQAGLYSLAEAPSLSYLLKDEGALSPDTYPLIGIIQRWSAGQLKKEMIAFSPIQILSHKSDISLKESDNVILLSRNDILSFTAPEEKTAPPESIDDDSDTKERSGLSNDIQEFLTEHSVFLRGSIRAAGSYPIANETTLEDLLSVAGGASLEANIRNIEITQPRADKTSQRTQINLDSTPPALITLHPGDTIRVGQNFRRIEDRHVLLTGEVKNPGTYDLIAGDTLGSLIKRAGGITEQAYPQGAIFSRKSERLREEQRYKSQARSLELSLAAAMQDTEGDKKPNAQEIAMARDLIVELKGAEALGRITVEADPGMLDSNPDLNILLESGDRVYIPKRPLTVRVAGEILSPAALQFRTGKSPRDYISEAGGFSYNADQDRTFVVYPDGSAQPLSVSAWNYKASMIPPGSTIIVPRDPKPLTFMDGAKDLSQILANLATTAIFADDISNGD